MAVVLLTCAFDVVIDEFAGVGALVGPCESSMAMLAALDVGSLVGGTIGPGLKTLTMLLVLLPVAFVLCAI